MASATPTPPGRPPFTPPAPPAPPALAAPASAAPVRWHSQQLLGSAREVEIAHGDALYRLRLTAQDKLILTK